MKSVYGVRLTANGLRPAVSRQQSTVNITRRVNQGLTRGVYYYMM